MSVEVIQSIAIFEEIEEESEEESEQDDARLMKCKECGELKQMKPYNYIRKRCAQCVYKVTRARLDSLEGRLKALVVSSRANSKSRLNKGRVEAGESTLTYDELLKIYNAQKGLCYYSGIAMTPVSGKPWLMSLERKNPADGYHAYNVVLSCWEFNHSVQWSQEKIVQLLSLINKPVDLLALQTQIDDARKEIIHKRQVETRDGILWLSCSMCLQMKSNADFNKHKNDAYGRQNTCKACQDKSKHTGDKKQRTTIHRAPIVTSDATGETLTQCSICKVLLPGSAFLIDPSRPNGHRRDCNDCRRKQATGYRNSLRGFIKSLTNKTTAHTEFRNRKRTREEDERHIKAPTLTVDQVLDKLEQQQGRCYYSGVPLAFEHTADWRTSLERLDDDGPYNVANVVLVCFEFNTTAKWSKEKFKVAFESIKKKYPAAPAFVLSTASSGVVMPTSILSSANSAHASVVFIASNTAVSDVVMQLS